MPSECFHGVFAAHASARRPSLAYYGDDAASKQLAASPITDVGFAPFDVGALKLARYAEPFTLLVGTLAYEGTRGPELAYRFEWVPAPS